MGWMFGSNWRSKAEMVAHLCERWSGEGGAYTVTLEKSVRGNVLWTVRESKRAGGEPEKWIGCDLLACSRGEWGYKDLDESVGPVETSCPLKFLAMVPCPGGYAPAWRERVKAAAVAKAAKAALVKALKPGSKVKLAEGISLRGEPVTEAEILTASPLVARFPNGAVAGLCKRHIAGLLAA